MLPGGKCCLSSCRAGQGLVCLPQALGEVRAKANPFLAEKYAVTTFPTLMVFEGGSPRVYTGAAQPWTSTWTGSWGGGVILSKRNYGRVVALTIGIRWTPHLFRRRHFFLLLNEWSLQCAMYFCALHSFSPTVLAVLGDKFLSFP